MELMLAVLFIVLLLTLYLIGVPVAYALGLTGLLMMFVGLIPYNPEIIAQATISGIDSFTLLAIPLFLLTGLYMNTLGFTHVIFSFAKSIVGPIRGGVAHVNVIASILFSGMSGAAAADAAGLGAIEYEAMQEEGYQKGFSTGVTGASSIIGPIIPPSIPLIIYGVIAEVSIGALFIAGVLPGLIMGASLLVMCTYFARKHEYDRGPSWSRSRIWRDFRAAVPALGTPVLIIGGILGGFFTATEAGAVALFYTVIVGYLFYDGVAPRELVNTTYKGLVTTAALTFIVGVAEFYGFLVRRAQIPQILGEFVTGLTQEPLLVLLLMVAVLLVVGLMIETIAAITILTPVFIPITAQVGIDPVHFGIVMVLALMIGLLTPPFGIILFILERVTDATLEEIMKGMVPFYLPLCVCLGIVILVEDITLVLPRISGLV